MVHVSFLGLWGLIELIHATASELYRYMRSPLSMLVVVIIIIITRDETAIIMKS